MKRQVAAIQAEGAAQMAQSCREMAAGMLVSAFTGAQAMCKDPADRAALCKRAATPRRGAARSPRSRPRRPKDLASLCGKDLAAMKAEACADAGRHEAERRCTDGSDKLLSFIGESCPAQTQVVAQRECAGRTYTDLTTCYRSFCTSYAANLLDKGKKPAPQPPKAGRRRQRGRQEGGEGPPAVLAGPAARAPRDDPRRRRRRGAARRPAAAPARSTGSRRRRRPTWSPWTGR